MHFYLARDLRPADRGDFVPEHEEADMETFWVPFDDLVSAVLEDRIADAPRRGGGLARARPGSGRIGTDRGVVSRRVHKGVARLTQGVNR